MFKLKFPYFIFYKLIWPEFEEHKLVRHFDRSGSTRGGAINYECFIQWIYKLFNCTKYYLFLCRFSTFARKRSLVINKAFLLVASRWRCGTIAVKTLWRYFDHKKLWKKRENEKIYYKKEGSVSALNSWIQIVYTI